MKKLRWVSLEFIEIQKEKKPIIEDGPNMKNLNQQSLKRKQSHKFLLQQSNIFFLLHNL